MPKTRDAFALRNLSSELFYFKAVYAMGENNLNARPKMKRACFDGLYTLSELSRRVVNHLMRLRRYQAALIKNLAPDDVGKNEIKEKNFRATVLFNVYEDIATNINETRREIEYLIEDIDLTERRDFMKVFSRRLRDARKAAGLTQEDLARRLGLKRSTYGQFEQGRNEPNISILPALTRELGLPADWFLGIRD